MKNTSELERAKKFAKENGFDTAVRERRKVWLGHSVYGADYTSGAILCVGLPQYIIFENNKPRFTTPFESADIFYS